METSDPQHEPDGLRLPLVGRDELLARIHQHALDMASPHALAVIGPPGSGKTSLLRALAAEDEDIIGVYISLRDAATNTETNWLRTLIEATNTALLNRDYSQNRLDAMESTLENPLAPALRPWINSDYLSGVTRLIRSHRRILWLLDDLEALLASMEVDHLPDDTLLYLHGLMLNHMQLGIVVTADLDAEGRLLSLAPFVPVEAIHRLHLLDPEATRSLLRSARPSLSDEDAAHIHAATGGHPQWLTLCAQTLNGQPQATIETIKQAVYPQVTADCEALWQRLSTHEQIILQAIVNLHYSDPLKAITPTMLEQWLIDSDTPLDATDIAAALRGLDYREIIGPDRQNLRLRSGFFERWCLTQLRRGQRVEQRRTTAATTPTPAAADSTPPMRRLSILLIVLIVIIVLGIIFATAGGGLNQAAPTAQPTVTLNADSS